MLIYEVNLSIEKKSAGKLAKWLPEHIERVLQLSGFQLVKVFCQEGAAPAVDRMFWTVQYDVGTQESFENYVKNHASALRSEGEKEFANTLEVTRRIIDKS